MKNSKLKLFVLGIGLTLAVSCNNREKNAETSNEATPAATENTSASGEVKLNPAHGQPGHDCAIPVGAPLNGTASNTPAPTSTTPQQSTTVSPVRINQTPTVNPPHGEPGHDCAVPVGAPLNQ